jgi:hypothetical protein
MDFCNICIDPQYCTDCVFDQDENPVQEEDNYFPLDDDLGNDGIEPKRRSRKEENTITLNDTTLYYKGEAYHILGRKEKNPNVLIFTTRGILFYIRPVEGRNVLIKKEKISQFKKPTKAPIS